MVALLAGAAGLLCAQPADSLTPSRLDGATIRELLKAHNDVRAQRQIAPLTWSPRLAEIAREWARHLAVIGTLEHDRTRPVGQNLFASFGAARRPSFVVGSWAGESKDYDERHFRCAAGAVCGHFTQLIWRDTKEVGCGVANGDNSHFWVCYYTPPGNFVGEKPY